MNPVEWNAYAIVILGALLARFALSVGADLLNLRAFRPELPAELRAVYDAERYRRAQEYTRARTRFALVPETAGLLALLAFWCAGGFAGLDGIVRSLGFSPVPSGLVFVGTLAVGSALLRLPFRWWSTFVVEERFGFNRTTARTFWTDVAKGAALAAVLGGTFLAAILWLLEHAGAHAWLWAWLAAAAFTVCVQLVVPTWILPLFNRFTPLGPGPLRDDIVAYARGVGFPLEDVFLIDGSRRSTKANAFFTGFGRRRRIALFDTLVERLSRGEIVAVLAHEVGHWRRRHVPKGIALGIAQIGLVLFLFSVFLHRPGLFAAFGVQEPSVYAGLVFLSLLLVPLDVLLSLGARVVSRRYEREADAFAVATTGAGAPLADALARLSADSLANPTPHPLYVFVNHSHPPVLERVRALRAGGA
jgi:STE24 endopeptidase